MSQLIEVKVPDIGDFSEVPVIDVCVKVGDRIEVDDAICTLESDKATMDVPASVAGVVKEVWVKQGDKVSEGSLLIKVEGGAAAAVAVPAPPIPAASAMAAAPVVAPTAGSHSGGVDVECDMLVLGAGPGGYSAAFRAADLGLKTVLVERYPTLGGVCLNVGCIPSKALLHVAAVLEEAQHLGDCGVSFAAPSIDLDKLRAHKDKVVGKLTAGLAGMAKGRKVQHLQGVGRFIDPHRLAVTAADGTQQVVQFKQAIIAAGSQPVALPFMPKDDPRVIDSTGALALRQVPKRMLVIGGGIIGLEMATVYSSLGARITVVELGPGLMPGADRDLVKVWEKKNAHRFERILLATGVTAAAAKPEGIEVTYSSGEQEMFDLVLVAVGRTPNGQKIGADKAGVHVDARGFIPVDAQMRTNVPHIFAIGDIVGQPMLAHKAVHEGHVAAEAAAGQKVAFDALQIPSVAYTHPEIAWAGKTEDQLKAEGIKFEKAVFPWAASGRAIANGAEEGFTKLLFDAETHRLLGGAIVGMNAGDLIGEICLAVEMGCDALDIGKTIHPHPTLCESIGMAAEVAHGSCTDLPPARKK
ncbi:MAG: dihydrolipoyl dehydrogenase [Azovibrio sp.]|nr:dihydrolipoyl dehydrogenase [Azovibrio sp.]